MEVNIKTDPTILRIVEIIEEVSGVKPEQIFGNRRFGKYTAARILLTNLIRKYTGYTTLLIFPLFGHVDHSTVLYYLEVHKEHIDTHRNPNFNNKTATMYGRWYDQACEKIDQDKSLVFFNPEKRRMKWRR
jgi:chromosomal replication initiation ATPase DnaA